MQIADQKEMELEDKQSSNIFELFKITEIFSKPLKSMFVFSDLSFIYSMNGKYSPN